MRSADWLRFLTRCLPDTGRAPDLIGVSTFHMSEMRLGWVPSLLRGRVSSHEAVCLHVPVVLGDPGLPS